MKNKKPLFSEFPPITTTQWEDRINEDLKGGNYYKKLVWKTIDGFDVQPYYRREHLEDKQYLESLPGEYPYTRGNNIQSNRWEIRQDILLDNIDEVNQKSLFILERGITSLGFVFPKGKNPFPKDEDFSRLLKNIRSDCIDLNFICGHHAPEILALLNKEVESKKIDKSHIHGAVDFDPLGYLTITGNYGIDEKSDFQKLSWLIETAEKKLPDYRVLGINGYFLHNAGASVVQELGYSLAIAVEYLTRLTDDKFEPDQISRHLQFNFSVGSNYFMEIAKIRAARTLWAKIVEAYNPKEERSKQTYIHSVTSTWNQTIYDPYNNVLRATSESMSAIIGGTNSLSIHPFTFAYKPTSKFSGRVARNIQIILKEEAYMDKIIDPAAGSYYIENLTDSLIAEAWKIILEVEEKGGYSEALKKGIVQKDIENTANNRDIRIASRRDTLIGTNQYPNIGEKMSDEVNLEVAFPQSRTNIGVVKPIKTYRGAIEFEKLRLATENHSKCPKVFLLTYGNLAMRRARAAFSSNFFGCAGYEIIDNPGFNSVDAGVKSALKHKADITVLCSSDEEYTELAPKVQELLNDKTLLVIAGASDNMEDLKIKGVKYFIHIKTNALETLQMFHQLLGITK